MCAEYRVQLKSRDFAARLGAPVVNLTDKAEWDARVKMTLPAPVLGYRDGEIKLNELIFPANPFPNARLSQSEGNRRDAAVSRGEDQVVRIYDVPLWKTSFAKFPCVVPMTSFCEPAYWGPEKGKVVDFRDPRSDILFVPAILTKPRVPATGKLNGFSLLTHTASAQMMDYHHRLLMFLQPPAALAYLRLGPVDPETRFDFLLEHRYIPEFATTVDRSMARGWERRVDGHVAALAAENTYLSLLEREDARG